MKTNLKITMAISILSLCLFKIGNAQNTFPGSGPAGIGTASPNNLLQVEGGSVAAYSQFTNTATGNNTASKGFLVGVDASGNAILNSNYSSGTMNFYTNGTQVGTFTSAGNFGVGTASPTNILSLGNGSAQKIWIENTTSGTKSVF